MARKTSEKGLPMSYKYPPKIDASPEKIAQVLFRARPLDDGLVIKVFRCAQCKGEVLYPETLFDGGLCSECAEVRNG